MFLHISAAAEFSIHLVNLVNLILLEVEGNGRKNAEENHQIVEAPRIVLTTTEAKVTLSPSQDWDMDPCRYVNLLLLQLWKQPRFHNHCSFCLFNLKNEAFCIMEVWIPHTTCCQWQTLDWWSDDHFITWCCIYLNEIIHNWRLISFLPLHLLNGCYRVTASQIL